MSLTPCVAQLLRDRQVAGLGHARRAARAGVAQHEHVVGVDVELGRRRSRSACPRPNRRRRRGRCAAAARRRRRLLDDRAARRQVAAQHRHAAAALSGSRAAGSRPARRACRARRSLAQRACRRRARVEVEQVGELVQQARHAAGPVEVLHVVRPEGFRSTSTGTSRPSVELVEIDRDAEPAGDRGEVDERRWSSRRSPAATTSALRNAASVISSLGRGPLLSAIATARVPLASAAAQPVGVRRRDARRVRQRHAHRLDDARHRARRAHHHAGAGGRREPAVDRRRSRLASMRPARKSPHRRRQSVHAPSASPW